MMNKEILKSDYRKKEILCGNFVFHILKYFEDLYGYKKMCTIVEELGLEISYVQKKSNWVSYEYYCNLLNKLVEVTNDSKAPYKVFLKNKKSSIFGGYYLNYPLNYFSPKEFSLKFKILLLIHKKISNIGTFEVLSSEVNYLKIKIMLNKGYKYDKNFCLAFQGYLTSIPLEFEKQSTKIKNKKCSKDYFIFTISWKKTRLLFLITLFSGLSFILFNAFLIHLFLINTIGLFTLFNLNFLIIIIALISFIIRKSFIYKKNDKLNLKVDNLIINIFDKIEDDYSKQGNIITDLSEHNKLLSIIININKINYSLYLNTALFETAKILIKELNFLKGLFFQYKFSDNKLECEFELFNKEKPDYSEPDLKKFIETNFTIHNLQDIAALGYSTTFYNLIKKFKIKVSDFKLTSSIFPNNSIFLLPINIPEQYFGFFLFFPDDIKYIENDFIFSIFDNVNEQIKSYYKNISNRKIIENIISNIPSFVIIFDIENFNIKFANNIFYSSFPGFSHKFIKEEIINSNLFSIINISKEDKTVLLNLLADLNRKEQIERASLKFGSNIYEYYLFSITSDDPYEKLAGIIMNDITETKYFQHQLLLNEKLISLGKIASGISHEINNPLYGILANAEEIIMDEKADKSTIDYSKEIMDFVMRISDIIKDLSAYSKTLRTEDFTVVDLNNIIDDSLNMLKYSSGFIDITVEKKFVKLKNITARKGELQQVFINLINNAIQAMDGSGILKINSKLKDNKIIITISDNGCGIKEEDQKHIFDLYFTTKAPEQGSGQGLHITKKILDRYNCDINFKSEMNKGTTFTLTFKL